MTSGFNDHLVHAMADSDLSSQGVRAMAQGTYERRIPYRPTPNANRFWIHNEQGYTDEELHFRTWIITVRQESGIHPDYLANPSTWFGETNVALTNINRDSWFFSNLFVPTHQLSERDFYVQPIDGPRLQHPLLYELMQRGGDYLVQRNQLLTQAHLNQPMNYVVLDINHMLRGLSQNPNMHQVQQQLERISRYVRAIETKLSPLIGSDRLFLSDFRMTINDKIQPMLTVKIQSQLLRERLINLSKYIGQLSEERNRVLHLALNDKPANPHPHSFSYEEIQDSSAYPTRAAQDCAKQHSSSELAQIMPPPLNLNGEDLVNCPNFRLITSDSEHLNLYATAVRDLRELDRFQRVLSLTIDLLGQYGEAVTIHQFKHQLLSLFDQIEYFIADSSKIIGSLLKINHFAYHKAIQDKQDLGLFKQLLTSEGSRLDTFIHNQDVLAGFQMSLVDLDSTVKAITEQTKEITSHLTQAKTSEASIQNAFAKMQELNLLMTSMHQWIKTQHELKGIEAPKAPAPLELPMQESEVTQTIKTPPFFHSPNPPPQPICAISPEKCIENISQSSKLQCSNPRVENNYVLIGLLALIPISVLIIYLLMRTTQVSPPNISEKDKEKFYNLKTRIDDKLTQLPKVEIDDVDHQHLIARYKRLLSKDKKGIYDITALESLEDDLNQLRGPLLPQTEEESPDACTLNC